jgi:hypothetical protein
MPGRGWCREHAARFRFGQQLRFGRLAAVGWLGAR